MNISCDCDKSPAIKLTETLKTLNDHCENDATILRKPRGWILWLIIEET